MTNNSKLVHVEVVQHVQASPEEAWDTYTDHANMSQWSILPASRLVREGNIERNGVGAVRSFLGGVQEEVLEFRPAERMAYTVIKGMLPVTHHWGEVTFEKDGSGTNVTWRCRFKPTIPGSDAVLKSSVSWVFRRTLIGLNRHLSP